MTDFVAWNPTSHPTVLLNDDVQLKHHGLEKTASYIARKNGAYYEVIKGGTSSGAGTIAFGGSESVGAAGTDPTAVLQAALTALDGVYGKLFIKNGSYVVDPLGIPDYTTVEGEDREKTILKLTPGYIFVANTETHVLRGNRHGTITPNHDITIRNLTCDVDGTNQTLGVGEEVGFGGVCLLWAYHSHIENVHVKNALRQGIGIWSIAVGSPGTYQTESTILNNFVESCGEGLTHDAAIFVSANHSIRNIVTGNVCWNNDGSGIEFEDYGARSVIANNICGSNSRHGFYIVNSDLLSITGNVSEDNTLNGFNIADSGQITVNGNVSYDNTEHGISVNGTSNSVILQGNAITENGLDGIQIYTSGGGGYGFTITGNDTNFNGNNGIIAVGNGVNYCNITGNSVFYNDQTSSGDHGIYINNSTHNLINSNISKGDDQGYGIYEVGTSDYNTIIGNNCIGNATLGVFVTGANTRVHSNIGYVTENSGTGTIATGGPPATSGNVAHGCDYTPALEHISIVLTENPTNTPGLVWVDSVDATNIVVKCENDPGASNLDFSWAVRRL